MRKALSLLFTLLAVLALLSGCSEEEPEAVTTAPATETTRSTETPDETIAPPETTEAATAPATLNTVVLREGDAALRRDYVLLAVSPDAPFLAKGVAVNEQGTDALLQWLMSQEAQEILGSFGAGEYGEPLFDLPGEAPAYDGWINKSNTASEAIRLAADETLVDTGLLDALLPVFEESYGYTVEVLPSSAAGTLSTARSGYADLVLTEYGDAVQTFMDEGYARTAAGFTASRLDLCSIGYLLCGPGEDPAGVADCASVGEAFAAIAREECTFLSRGDGSPVHMLEQRFWPEGQEFGDWYIAAELEMGPCLVMNEMEGGYILTDKLTWLLFFNENGII